MKKPNLVAKCTIITKAEAVSLPLLQSNLTLSKNVPPFVPGTVPAQTGPTTLTATSAH